MTDHGPRLIHLNGAPGVGKSTLARRFAADHPGTLNLDIDVLRTLIGGWHQDFLRAGALVRPVAQAALQAHLRAGHDVVLPQLTARADELAAFRRRAEDAGARHVHLVLTADEATTWRRFTDREVTADPHDPGRVTADHVAAEGGASVVHRYRSAIADLATADPATVVIGTDGADEDTTYARLLRELDRRGE